MHPHLQLIRQEIEEGNALLLDVREQEEWELGHIRGAHHFPFTRVEEGELPELPTDKPLYLYCRRANRAAKAIPHLKGRYPKLEIIPWGFEDLWAAVFPVE